MREEETPEKKQKRITGEIILDEFSDLKRIGEEEAPKIGVCTGLVARVYKAEASQEEQQQLLFAMSNAYPIDASDLWVPKDDTKHGVKIMRQNQSKASQRSFNRPVIQDSDERSPFYDYDDTAMSSLSPIKPEWIRELRVVENSDPYNPKAIFNNGHSMEQLTFFKGPVNFYWIDKDGRKHCEEMNTGDSNYITPFYKHTFTSRNPSQEALIMAVTFGGEVRRARKELYNLGPEITEKAAFDYRNPKKAVAQLLDQHIRNERMSVSNLQTLLEDKGVDIDLGAILSGKKKITSVQRRELSRALNVEPTDLILPPYRPEEEVIVTHHNKQNRYLFPSSENPSYELYTLARTSKKPLMKAHNILVLETDLEKAAPFETSLHSWAYNYSEADVAFLWRGIDDKKTYTDILHHGDSAIVLPFTQHSFASLSQKDAYIVTVGVPGSLNLLTQKELSFLTDQRRASTTSKKWFD